MPVASVQSIEIFLSYSHKDEALLYELEKHLSILKRQGVIAVVPLEHVDKQTKRVGVRFARNYLAVFARDSRHRDGDYANVRPHIQKHAPSRPEGVEAFPLLDFV